jgi:hypothetical protein
LAGLGGGGYYVLEKEGEILSWFEVVHSMQQKSFSLFQKLAR